MNRFSLAAAALLGAAAMVGVLMVGGAQSFGVTYDVDETDTHLAAFKNPNGPGCLAVVTYTARPTVAKVNPESRSLTVRVACVELRTAVAKGCVVDRSQMWPDFASAIADCP